MATQTLQTTNFTIQYDPVVLPNSPKRANALLGVVENEFTALTGWFGVTGGFGTNNRIIINLVGSLPRGSANNGGYKSDGTTTMNLIAQDANANDTQANAIVLMLFVAEFVEILMGYRNTQGPATWNAGYSHGEGLSLFCAELRFSAGYQALYGTWVNPWLQLPNRDAAANDWISNPETTDSDSLSFGCSLLFLFYLKSQLNHTPADIIQQGGSTLEITYQNLTGQSGAITAFRNLINPYFPVGKTPQLLTDDPFPLLKGNQRQVDIAPSFAAAGAPSIARIGEANVSPGLLCPKKDYTFEIFRTPKQLTCVATAKGFGQPVYKWRVNGVDVPATAAGVINPSASVTIDQPTSTSLTTTVTEAVPISYALTSTTFTSTLVMTCASTFGHVDLIVEALATEKYASTDETGGIDWITVSNELIVWEQKYYDDRAACEARWNALVRRFVRFDVSFNILHTLPDPPPDYGRVLRQLEQLSAAVKEMERHSEDNARQIEQAVETAFGINAKLLHAIGKLGRVTRGGPAASQKSA